MKDFVFPIKDLMENFQRDWTKFYETMKKVASQWTDIYMPTKSELEALNLPVGLGAYIKEVHMINPEGDVKYLASVFRIPSQPIKLASFPLPILRSMHVPIAGKGSWGDKELHGEFESPARLSLGEKIQVIITFEDKTKLSFNAVISDGTTIRSYQKGAFDRLPIYSYQYRTMGHDCDYKVEIPKEEEIKGDASFDEESESSEEDGIPSSGGGEVESLCTHPPGPIPLYRHTGNIQLGDLGRASHDERGDSGPYKEVLPDPGTKDLAAGLPP